MDTDEPACPAGFITIGVFFLFGATMAAFAAITLLKPGTALDALWVLNRAGHTQLASLDKGVGLGSLVLSVLLCTASIGWFRRRDWGCRLGTTIIAINAAGDLVNLMAGETSFSYRMVASESTSATWSEKACRRLCLPR